MSRQIGLNTPGGADTQSSVPLELLVAAFRDEQTAMHALRELKAAQQNRFPGIRSVAVLRKDQVGRLHIKETADLGGGRGAVIGGVLGAVIGVISGAGLVAPAVVGALIGGLAASLRESRFSSERLNRLGKDLKPGTSVIVAVMGHPLLSEVERVLRDAGADVFTEELDSDVAAQLEAGHDVAYNALVAREGLAIGRIAASASEIKGGMLVADDTGFTSSQFMVTEQGFAVRAIEIASDRSVVDEATYE